MAKPQGIREYFITGLFALLPLALSVMVAYWIMVLLWEKFFSVFVPGVEAVLDATLSADIVAGLERQHVPQVIGFVLLLLFILGVGFVARRFIGKSLLSLLDRIVAAIPGLNFIYGTIRQFTATMDPESPQHDAFRHAVIVKLQGGMMLGFLTSRSTVQGKKMATVFLPCNQLIQGYNMMVPEKDVVALDMKVDDALKYVISFGMVAPAIFKSPSGKLEK